MEKFALRKDEKYIQLNDLLKVMSWVASGGEAKQLILSEQVLVNGEIETRIRKKIYSTDTVEFNGKKVAVNQ